MRSDLLHVIAPRMNPIGYQQPERIYAQWVQHMLDSGVQLTVPEVAYGDRPFVANLPGVNHIPLRARTWVWSKENMINIALSRLPLDAKYICWHDSDVFHDNPQWAAQTVHALQRYSVVQPWNTCIDRGPNNEVMQLHKSFCSLFHAGKPVVPTGPNFWDFQGGYSEYSHTGYVWAATRQFFEWVGGLIEICSMGSGDHVMAYGLVGEIEKTYPGVMPDSYTRTLKTWESRALQHVNRNIGFVPGVINHKFHGAKANRKYIDRWEMFIKHNFDPSTDLKKNSFGVLEWSGNKPELEREFDLYLRSRNEDANTL